MPKGTPPLLTTLPRANSSCAPSSVSIGTKTQTPQGPVAAVVQALLSTERGASEQRSPT